jgi:hypothetical protein
MREAIKILRAAGKKPINGRESERVAIRGICRALGFRYRESDKMFIRMRARVTPAPAPKAVEPRLLQTGPEIYRSRRVAPFGLGRDPRPIDSPEVYVARRSPLASEGRVAS